MKKTHTTEETVMIQLATRVPKVLYRALKLYCVEHDEAITDFVTAAIGAALVARIQALPLEDQGLAMKTLPERWQHELWAHRMAAGERRHQARERGRRAWETRQRHLDA